MFHANLEYDSAEMREAIQVMRSFRIEIFFRRQRPSPMI
jgi:hypothetical protein